MTGMVYRQSLTLLVLVVLTSCMQQKPAQVISLYNSNPASFTNNPYRVKVGKADTVYTIAKNHHVDLRHLIDINRLRPPYILTPGHILKIPTPKYHQVQEGDTIYAISRSYGVDMASLMRSNKVENPTQLYVGKKIRIPYASYAAVDLNDTSIVQIEPASDTITAYYPEPKGKSTTAVKQVTHAVAHVAPQSPINEPGVPLPLLRPNDYPKAQLKPNSIRRSVAKINNSSSRVAKNTVAKANRSVQVSSLSKPQSYRSGNTTDFIWPIKGKVISRFGPKTGGLYNDGINIAAPKGSSIKAAAGGKVVYAGSELRGYGNLLLIKHDNGFMTAYAHAEKILVKKGTRVNKGQVIAKVGRSGNVSKDQLHFSIRKGRKALDPSRYLKS